MYESNHLITKLRQAATDRETDTFVNGDNGRTFGQFFSNAEKIAALLVHRGVQPGQRVAVQVDKSLEALELYIGTIMAGAAYLPLNPDYTASEVAYFLQDASPKLFVVDPEREIELHPVATGVGGIDIMTLSASGGGTLVTAAREMDAEFVPIARSADDLAAILYTSGTTGRSKGAMLTHRALASNAETLVDYWRFSPKDVLIHALPIFHTHGLFVATNVALMAGSSIEFLPKFDREAIFKAMASATVLMGVPTFYTRLLNDSRLSKKSTSNMRLFISGSAPLMAETHDQWTLKTGHEILERYGMTETNMNTSNPYDGVRKPGTVGVPLPGIEVNIVDENRKIVGVDEIGSIEVRGDNVFAGYWQMPEKTAEELKPDGWFITGDLGVKDTDGYISIVGRSKDLIITGGFNVYPKEVEAVTDDISEVLESAVIGIPHPDFGEAVVAVVVTKDGAEISPNEIITLVSQSLAKYKCPKNVIVVNELPRNTMGKVQKNLLREEYSDLFA